MIKELFEIEAQQKNVLICLLGMCFLSFLQLYLFKNEILNKSSFEIVGICLALTVCWTILNIPPLLFFHLAQITEESSKKTIIYHDRVIFGIGMLALSWVLFLTYISYELKLCFRDFVRVSIIVSIIRTLFWLIYGSIKSSMSKTIKTNG